MAIAGRVAIVPKGDWSAETEYKRLDEVTYNNTMFIAKKAVPKGTLPTNAEYWSKSIVGGVGAIATKEDAGIVKPADGLSIVEDGTLKVSIDGTTLTMDQVNNVIKLADTLKEKINGAFPAANLINNLTTTEAGFGLDARQGKALDDKITEINGSLKGVLNEVTIILPQHITVLGYINSMDSPIGCQTFNSDVTSDSPLSTGEFSILWFGSGNARNGMRYHVIAIPYSVNPNVSKKIYARELFNQSWNTDWYEL